MLVLTRRPGESILIDGGIKVTVLTLCRDTGQVRIGIDAPKEVSIVREELLGRPFRETTLREVEE